MTLKAQAHLGLLATNLFFAINLGAIKYFTGHNYAAPYGLNIIRIGISVILFWILFILNPVKKKIHKEDIGRFILCALTALAVRLILYLVYSCLSVITDHSNHDHFHSGVDFKRTVEQE